MRYPIVSIAVCSLVMLLGLVHASYADMMPMSSLPNLLATYGDTTTVSVPTTTPPVALPTIDLGNSPTLLPPPPISLLPPPPPPFFPLPVPAQPTTTVVTPTTLPVTPVRNVHFLQMANGSWYDPQSGKSAPTEVALENALGLPSTTITNVPTPFWPAEGSSTSANTQVTSSTSSTIVFPLLAAIQRAQALLKVDIIPSDPAQLLDSEPGSRPIELAIWTEDTNQIDIVHVQKDGTDLSPATVDGFQITVLNTNGLNSDFSVVAPTGTAIVVGIKYPIYDQVTIGRKTGYEREDVVYTPFSQALETPEMITWGKQLLDQKISDVYASLDQMNVKSTSFPGKALTDVIRPELARSLMLIEHSDQTTLEADPQNSLNVFYTTVGANGETAYAYSASDVGALGVAQFMPATYHLLTQNSNVGLIPDFQTGMRSLQNSIKAQVVYLDRILAVMPDDIRAQEAETPGQADEYLVASYNAGEGKIKRALATWGAAWDVSHIGHLESLESQQSQAASEVARLKRVLKKKHTKKLTASYKRQLISMEDKYDTLTADVEVTQKSILEPETLYYLAKYRAALPYIMSDSASAGSTLPSA